MSAEEAERLELMVHLHFDAKYRLDRIGQLFGDDENEAIHDHAESVSQNPTAAKYADLLKMHAYRDAIRRSYGAYVLYPGNPEDGNKHFWGYHEILPGLGAFAVRPDKDGKPRGMEAIEDFLEKIIAHLADRTTVREQVSCHVFKSYQPHNKT